MADKKISELLVVTAMTTSAVQMDTLAPIVVDFATVPVTKSITIYNLLAGLARLIGRPGGQTIQGGTQASEELTLESTAHATKGHIHLKDATYINTLTTAGIVRNSAAGLLSTDVNDFDRIYSNLLAVDTTSVTIPTISQAYTTLKLVMSGRCTRASNHVAYLCAQVSGITGATYDNMYHANVNTTVTLTNSQAQTSAVVGLLAAADADVDYFSSIEMIIPHYSSTTKKPQWHAQSALQADTNAATQYMAMASGRERTAGAVTSIKLFTQDGSNFLTGTQITLYGLK